MRIRDLENKNWISWKKGADNSQANTDIPLSESFDMINPTPAMQSIIDADSSDQGWVEMTQDEFWAYMANITNG